MNADDLFTLINELIDMKGTSPKVLTFAQAKQGIVGDEETRDSFRTLVREKRIRIREGKNDKLIEIL